MLAIELQTVRNHMMPPPVAQDIGTDHGADIVKT